MKIQWTNIKVKLGDLKPWANNPRFSTKAQAQRLLDSFEKFGQVQTVAVDPTLNVLDGHQRLSALLTIYGNDYEIDARQSDRALTDRERRELVITLHTSAVGGYDWEQLSGWDVEELKEFGFDRDALIGWNNDASNLLELISSEDGIDPNAEWKDMPEFGGTDEPMRTINVHFVTQDDIDSFSKLISQQITSKTKFIWYPERIRRENKDMRYGINP